MEDNTLNSPSSGPVVCDICRIEPAMEGYPNKLCYNCRQKYVRYPIPKWIYAFGFGVLVIMLSSLVKLPRHLSVAVAYSKAEKAMEARNYLTAQKQLAKVLAEFPDIREAQVNMLIAACYNKNMELVLKMYSTLAGQYFENGVLSRINPAMDFIQSMLPKDSTIKERISKASVDSGAGLQKLFSEIDTSGSDEKPILEYLVADKLYDFGKYEDCRTILLHILKNDSSNYLSIRLMSAVNRNLKNYDEAIADCRQLLEFNREDVQAIAQMAKIELKRKRDSVAAEYADKAYALDNKDPLALEAKTLVSYCAGRKEESAEMLAELKIAETDSDKVVYTRTNNILNGTESFR